MAPDAEFVRIASFDSLAETAVVHALLEAHGIRLDPENVAPVGLLWPVAPLLGRVDLQVAAADAERALALVEAYRRGELAVEDGPGEDGHPASDFLA